MPCKEAFKNEAGLLFAILDDYKQKAKDIEARLTDMGYCVKCTKKHAGGCPKVEQS